MVRRLAGGRLHYAWIVAGVTFLALLGAAGFRATPGVLIGLGAGSMASVLGATVANRWFVKRRGAVLGVMTAAGATGQLIFLPSLAALAVDFGWRYAAVMVTCGALLVLPVVALLMRSRPADVGLSAYGATVE